MVFTLGLFFHRIGREMIWIQLGKVESFEVQGTCHATRTWIDVHEVAPAHKERCYWAIHYGPRVGHGFSSMPC